MLFRQSRRALAAWAGAAVCGLVAAHGVAGDLASLHRRARSAGPEVPVVVTARDVPLGATITGADLVTVRRHRRHLPRGFVSREPTARGRVATTPLLEGAVLTERHLAPEGRTGLDGVVPPGMRAVRVVAEDAVVPEPGAVVDVLATFDPSLAGPEGQATVEAVRGALVISVDAGDDTGAGSRAARVAVTVLTDTEGARRLAYATANGIVTLALVPPEEACCRSSKTSSSVSSRG